MALRTVTRRTLLAGAFAAATALPARVRAQGGGDLVKVLIATDKGDILAGLEEGKAPITCANFLRYVDAARYDGASIYRAVQAPGAPDVGLIEGGIDDPRKLYPPIAHESTALTGLKHLDGTLSMARDAPGTAASDFFVCAGPASYLDANPAATGDNAGYAAFGRVLQGMEIVRTILALPTTGLARNPSMQGQILDPPVRILAMKRTG
ncbi:MAG TPA: peptidylprolyl isomerase [Caulobacteraceae bacterium]|nr:peptidylprolyl isomerase [Caulobacteraceae bacterium]